MEIEDFVKKLFKGETATIDIPRSVDFLVEDLWESSIKAIKGRPKELMHVKIRNKNLQNEINKLIEEFNIELTKQEGMYIDLFKSFLR